MKNTNNKVHFINDDEWAVEEKDITQADKDGMNVESYYQKSMKAKAEKEGLIPDEDWMKKL